MSRSLSLLLLCVALLIGGCQSPQAAPPPVARAPQPAPRAVPRPAPPVVISQAPVAVRSVTAARGSAFEERNVPVERVLARAAETGRPAILYFCAAWCGYCSKMNRETLSRPEVKARLAERFVAVEYDVDTARGRAAAQRYGARGYPTMVIVDSSGSVKRTIVGARDPQTFLSLLGELAP